MDLVSIFGILLAFTAIIGGQILEGGHIGSLMQLTAFIIVLGGTTGAIMLQSSPKIFFEGMRLAKWIIWPPKANPQLLIEQVLTWSNLARKGGLLALESQLDQLEDPFTKKGLQMLVDGAEPEKIRAAL